MRFIGLAILLSIFWVVNSGQLNADHIFLVYSGIVCVIGTTWVSLRLGAMDKESNPLPFLLRSCTYVPWLMWQIVLSNIHVAKLVWSPKPQTTLCLFRIPVNLKTGWCITAYANSITLTPGTVTVDVGEDEFLIHSLTTETRDDLLTGEMHAAVQKLEG